MLDAASKDELEVSGVCMWSALDGLKRAPQGQADAFHREAAGRGNGMQSVEPGSVTMARSRVSVL